MLGSGPQIMRDQSHKVREQVLLCFSALFLGRAWLSHSEASKSEAVWKDLFRSLQLYDLSFQLNRVQCDLKSLGLIRVRVSQGCDQDLKRAAPCVLYVENHEDY